MSEANLETCVRRPQAPHTKAPFGAFVCGAELLREARTYYEQN